MGWEKRGNRRYYYDARRIGGRVFKTYVGAGPAAVAIAKLNELGRERKKWTRIDRELADARRAERGRRLAEFFDVGDRLTARWLTAAGFHRHHRGEWRKRQAFQEHVPMQLIARQPFDEWDTAALVRAGGDPPKELAERAAKGDRGVLPELEGYLTDHPAAVTMYGDVGRHMLKQLVRTYAQKDLLYEKAILRQADGLRRKLAGDDPNAIEVLLAERAVVGWLTTALYEYAYARQMNDLKRMDSHQFHERRIEAANRRFLAALKTLAAVRRLKLPDMLAIVKVEMPARSAPTDGGS